jgi:folylpolyglutamate synthase/dihydrofolate synthase
LPKSLPEWLDHIERQHARSIELGLDRVRAVALDLDLLPCKIPTLTIAGTNGKGSSATLAGAILRAGGHVCGVYTSPHLLRYNERVQIDGRPVDDAALCAAFEAVEHARGATPLTYFEYGTLAALWLFQRAAVDVQVLEVGLGGRLDAVNVIDPEVALLTNVGLDHRDWLGDDREQIGAEKAGIFRSGRVAVLGEPDPPQSVLRHAAALGAPLRRAGIDFHRRNHPDGRWSWQGGAQCWDDLPAPALAGAYQYDNAAAVLAALQALSVWRPVDAAAVRRGLTQVHLEGRLQRHGRWLLDVAHNAEAAGVLAAHLRTLTPAPRRLVLGMLADKPIVDVARLLGPLFERVHCAGLPGPRGLSGAALAALLTGAGFDAEAHADVAEAMQAAADATTGTVVVAGSFLTVAAALADKEILRR